MKNILRLFKRTARQAHIDSLFLKLQNEAFEAGIDWTKYSYEKPLKLKLVHVSYHSICKKGV
jgi:hypothetical protein